MPSLRQPFEVIDQKPVEELLHLAQLRLARLEPRDQRPVLAGTMQSKLGSAGVPPAVFGVAPKTLRRTADALFGEV